MRCHVKVELFFHVSEASLPLPPLNACCGSFSIEKQKWIVHKYQVNAP